MTWLTHSRVFLIRGDCLSTVLSLRGIWGFFQICLLLCLLQKKDLDKNVLLLRSFLNGWGRKSVKITHNAFLQFISFFTLEDSWGKTSLHVQVFKINLEIVCLSILISLCPLAAAEMLARRQEILRRPEWWRLRLRGDQAARQTDRGKRRVWQRDNRTRGVCGQIGFDEWSA